MQFFRVYMPWEASHLFSREISRRMHSESCLGTPWGPIYDQFCKTCVFRKGRKGRDPLSSYPLSSDPLSSDPLSSDPHSSDPLSSDPLSSDPLSSDPLSRDPLSRDPLRSDPLTRGPLADVRGPSRTFADLRGPSRTFADLSRTSRGPLAGLSRISPEPHSNNKGPLFFLSRETIKQIIIVGGYLFNRNCPKWGPFFNRP